MSILAVAALLLPLAQAIPAAAERAAASSATGAFVQSYSSFNTTSWYPFTFGSYVGDDGDVTSIPGGFHISSVFSRTAPPEGPTPGDLDHVKWLYWLDATSSGGYPGWDTQAGSVNECTAKVSGTVTGAKSNPLGAPPTSPNIANFGVTAGDFETNMIFDFLATDDAIYALYERLPFVRSATNNYASFSYLIKVRPRKQGDADELKIAYDRSANTVTWLINGKQVYQVSRLGRYIGKSQVPAVDRGGDEEDVKELKQFACGVGIFNFMDGYEKTLQRSLVKLNPAPGYYENPKNEKKELQWVDTESKESSRIWGQGVQVDITDFEVARRIKN